MFQLSLYQQETNKNLSKLLSKGFEKNVYWNENK